MKMFYLDFDGVLHHENVVRHPKHGISMEAHGHSLFEWVSILEELLSPHPEVKIVLSTSWVVAKSFDFARSCLPPTLQSCVIGATFLRGHHDRRAFMATWRGQQIAADVFRRGPEAWFALDDDGLHWPHWCRDNLILTDGNKGISDPAIQQAIVTMLKRF